LAEVGQVFILFQTCWGMLGSSPKIRVGQTVKPDTFFLCRSIAEEVLIKQNMEKTQALEHQVLSDIF
jgi:hypothetical protein